MLASERTDHRYGGLQIVAWKPANPRERQRDLRVDQENEEEEEGELVKALIDRPRADS